MEAPLISQIIKIRRILHDIPELSGKEAVTAETIIGFLKTLSPKKIITQLGGHGVMAVFEGHLPGTVLLFRAELDAVPIASHRKDSGSSEKQMAAHLCGHDGHIAILLGLAALINQQPLARGRVALLFQPAEETGQGAQAVLNDPRFSEIVPDFVFAFHNLPGFPLKQVVINSGNFTSASIGARIRYLGRSSHAAEPKKGKSPLNALAKLIMRINKLPAKISSANSSTFATITHIQSGAESFGINPGDAMMMITLRADSDENLAALQLQCEDLAYCLAKPDGLDVKIEYADYFPATIHQTEAVQLVLKAAKNLGMKASPPKKPFCWSEDFGYFTKKFKGALIGLGAGTVHPALHSTDYVFPDELISPAAELLHKICTEALA